MCKKDYIRNLAKCTCKNGRYTGKIIDDSLITCDEIKETKTNKQKKQKKQRSKTAPTKSTPTNFNEKKGNL